MVLRFVVVLVGDLLACIVIEGFVSDRVMGCVFQLCSELYGVFECFVRLYHKRWQTETSRGWCPKSIDGTIRNSKYWYIGVQKHTLFQFIFVVPSMEISLIHAIMRKRTWATCLPLCIRRVNDICRSAHDLFGVYRLL